MNDHRGFTLIEVLIAMVVTFLILGGAYAVFNTQQRQTTVQTNVSDAQQNLRAAMDFMSREIRMAGYNPRQTTANFGIQDIKFRNINDATAATGNSYIRFTWDKDSDGVLDANETVDISLVDNGTITPGIADLYMRLPNDTNVRDVLASNIVSLGLAFAYDANDDGELDEDAGGNTLWSIDANNDGVWDKLVVDQSAGTATITATANLVDTRSIRAIRIWMLSQSQAPDPKFTDTNTYVVGSHVVTPNNNFRHRLLERVVLCRNMGLNL